MKVAGAPDRDGGNVPAGSTGRWRRLYLLRHEEAAYFGPDGRPADPSEVSLTARGRAQARDNRSIMLRKALEVPRESQPNRVAGQPDRRISFCDGSVYNVWMADTDAFRARHAALSDHLDERARRIFAAAEAKTAQ